jgi:hypothetical protein
VAKAILRHDKTKIDNLTRAVTLLLSQALRRHRVQQAPDRLSSIGVTSGSISTYSGQCTRYVDRVKHPVRTRRQDRRSTIILLCHNGFDGNQSLC